MRLDPCVADWAGTIYSLRCLGKNLSLEPTSGIDMPIGDVGES